MGMNIDKIASEIGIPTEGWIGNCHSISCAIVEQGLVKGKARYGHWLGPADPDSMKGLPFVRHGWIECEDGTIIDPTRWVFEGTKPYIWVGTNDGNYDPGGNIWRKKWERPCPDYGPRDKKINLNLQDEDRSIIIDMLGNPLSITIKHAFWLANLSIVTLGMVLAKSLYGALEQAGLIALVPIDNWDIVMSE